MPIFKYNDIEIKYTLSRNAKKNVNFRIKPNGEVCISAPRRGNLTELEKMIFEKADWILKTQEKILNKKKHTIEKDIKNNTLIFLNGNQFTIKIMCGNTNRIYIRDVFLVVEIKESFINSQEYINNYFENYLKELTFKITDNLIDKHLDNLKQYNLKKPNLTIRNMTSRWGSCIPSKNKITINKNLIYPPHECLDYVVLHELSHLVEANHSKNFYNIIEKVMPDWKERKNILNNF